MSSFCDVIECVAFCDPRLFFRQRLALILFASFFLLIYSAALIPFFVSADNVGPEGRDAPLAQPSGGPCPDLDRRQGGQEGAQQGAQHQRGGRRGGHGGEEEEALVV